jgi:hypothetical protein
LNTSSFILNRKSLPKWEALCKRIDWISLASASSQAAIAPLTEELVTKKAAQGAGNRLKDHFVFLSI